MSPLKIHAFIILRPLSTCSMLENIEINGLPLQTGYGSDGVLFAAIRGIGTFFKIRYKAILWHKICSGARKILSTPSFFYPFLYLCEALTSCLANKTICSFV